MPSSCALNNTYVMQLYEIYTHVRILIEFSKPIHYIFQNASLTGLMIFFSPVSVRISNLDNETLFFLFPINLNFFFFFEKILIWNFCFNLSFRFHGIRDFEFRRILGSRWHTIVLLSIKEGNEYRFKMRQFWRKSTWHKRENSFFFFFWKGKRENS